MSAIAHNLSELRAQLPPHVTLVAVSKTKPVADLEEAYRAGQRHFGENRIQEMASKWEALPKDICWHMIGHVQTNKIKYMAPFVHLVHGIDSAKALEELNKQAARHHRVIDFLLQVYIAREETKFGLDDGELEALLADCSSGKYPHTRLRGLMGMASFTADQAVVLAEFNHLNALFKQHQEAHRPNFDTLSMGMSGDWPLAVQAGSTLIRVGSSIFGSR
jgi:pyridoxal phosphate enzyme (YggS family)